MVRVATFTNGVALGLCSAYLLSQKGPWTCEQVSKWNKSLSFGGLSLKSLNFVKKYFVI